MRHCALNRILAAGLCAAAILAFPAGLAAQTFQPSAPWWGGVHAGAYGGYGWGANVTNETGPLAYNAIGNAWKHDVDGPMGGLRAGWDWESYALVMGMEAGLGYLGATGEGADPASGGLDTVAILASGPYAELTGRIGWGPDRELYYVKGGAVFADLDLSVADSCTVAPCGPAAIDAGSDGIETGWVMGAGIGYALTERMSVAIEYDYIRFASLTATGTSGGTAHSWDQDLKLNTVAARIDWRF